MSHETKKRSFTKTVTWRILATLLTWAVIYFYTGKIFESAKITIVAAILSMVAYYLHERIWDKINWERK